MPIVAIGKHWQIDCIRKSPHRIHHLSKRQQLNVRSTKQRSRVGVAATAHDLESRALDDRRTQRIVGNRNHQDLFCQ